MKKLSYHEPEGLAACEDQTGAYHCDKNEIPAYEKRFLKTFGFYDGLAAVEDASGCYHINQKAQSCYNKRFLWTGNFQEKFCSVQDESGFYHINICGEEAYPERYSYVGDFRYGYAVVYKDNKAFHIHKDGTCLYSKKFLYAGSFHKGFAVVRDSTGYFHIDIEGNEIYSSRYMRLEDFYNRIAFAEDFEGNKIRLRESGYYTMIANSLFTISTSDLLNKINKGAKAGIIIRHSSRETINNYTPNWGNQVNLTKDGYNKANKLGQTFLNVNTTVFSSPLPRCIQTGEAILEGIGIKTKINQDSYLGNPGCYFDGTFSHEKELNEKGLDFWEEYLKEGKQVGLKPLSIESIKLIEHIKENMKKPITWFVSHDVHLACLMHFLGLRTPTKTDWIHYLEGVAVIEEDKSFCFYRFDPLQQ